MNAQQKDAVYCLILSGLTLVTFFTLWALIKGDVALSAFAIFGFYGLTPVIFYKKVKDKVIFDERDLEIKKKAGSFAFRLFWVVFVLAAVLIPLLKGFEGYIEASFLLFILLFGVLLISVSRSIRILMLYRQVNAE